jgi:hypothetical protein
MTPGLIFSGQALRKTICGELITWIAALPAGFESQHCRSRGIFSPPGTQTTHHLFLKKWGCWGDLLDPFHSQNLYGIKSSLSNRQISGNFHRNCSGQG